MAKCETCGNEYDGSFEVTLGGTTHTFDSFECAIHAVAPRCAQCSVPIVGTGFKPERNWQLFCCNHCAAEAGVHALRDRE